ncbi:DUF3574 domain-containing protein [Brytella acorum]|uniref:DUF3574 domain-containing protein n=1 Tax=Brytella acorum TaxID=2959299 RepID=A0AA35Y3Z4_9PROT|nr:DUF3574 domain-containing protein [Brytella acorum]MDF3624157.1 DUF3574 domain-containing protein [Brytella acorum]CAI9120663.1 DUF3574 domain-containing protein [Brytella acorum]
MRTRLSAPTWSGLIGAMSIMLAGCTPTPDEPHALCMQTQAKPDLQIRLMFGLMRDDGRRISDAEWQHYSDEVLSVALPDGFSVIPADGTWKDPRTGQTDREPSRIVWAAIRPSPTLAARLDAARAVYRTRFSQHSVGLIISSGCESF